MRSEIKERLLFIFFLKGSKLQNKWKLHTSNKNCELKYFRCMYEEMCACVQNASPVVYTCAERIAYVKFSIFYCFC